MHSELSYGKKDLKNFLNSFLDPNYMPDSAGNGSGGLVLPMTSLLSQQPLSASTQIPPLNNNDSTTQLYLDMNALSCPTNAQQHCLTPHLSNPTTPFAQHLQHNEMHLLQQQQLAATVAAVAAAQQNFNQQQFQQHQLQQHLNQQHLLQPQQRLAQLSDTIVAYTSQS